MEIIIKGNKKEIETAKDVMEGTCMYMSEYCEKGLSCEDCGEKQTLKIKYEESEE